MINIFYCSDNKLFGQQVISLLSLVKYTDEPLNVFNLTIEVHEYNIKSKKTSKEQNDYCDAILKAKNKQSSFTTIDISDLFRKYLFPSVNSNCKYYSYYVTVRLLADLVPELPDKIIYLDTDVIANGDIKELWNIDVENYDFAGRKDVGRITKYLQTGVMLFNLKKMRENGALRKACELCVKKKYVCYIDMTAINTSCKDKLVIDTKYNLFKYSPNSILHHICATREGKIPFTKKWWHRIKIDEIKFMRKKLPVYNYLMDDIESRIKANPELFTAIPKQ